MLSNSIRLYVDAPLCAGGTVPLSPAQSHYLLNVMRLKLGDCIRLFNGTEGEWSAQLLEVHKKHSSLSVLEELRPQSTDDIPLWLCFAPVKNVPIVAIAQKATELGVCALQPVLTQRTMVARLNREKLWANAVEAAEQSERLSVPEVMEMMPLSRWISNISAQDVILFADESGRGHAVAEAFSALKGREVQRIFVLIGPEGGFSEQERQVVRAHPQVIAFHLGPRILRADTAAIAALVCVQAMYGDWHHKPRFIIDKN